MAEETAKAEKKEESVVCYISKKVVPMSETVEVSYGAGKKYRVLPKYLKH